MQVPLRLEPEAYEIAKQLLKNEETAVSLLKALRSVVKSLGLYLFL
ncbi:MAG: hypothetical protein ACREBQ_09580 [Nitrososphaerales archaeon]